MKHGIEEIKGMLDSGNFLARHSFRSIRLNGGRVICISHRKYDLNIRFGGKSKHQIDVHVYAHGIAIQSALQKLRAFADANGLVLGGGKKEGAGNLVKKVYPYDWANGVDDQMLKEILSMCEMEAEAMKDVVEDGKPNRPAPLTSGRVYLQCVKTEFKLPDDYKCKELDQILAENPWRKFGEKLEKCKHWSTMESFALEEDKEKISRFNAKTRNDDLRLKIQEQEPIPFIGHPDAKVWLLLMNPKFSWAEYYTFIDMQLGLELIKEHKVDGIIRTETQAEESFRRRQRLYVQSLSFKNQPDEAFYILDESMNVLSGTGDLSGYLWYGNHCLCGHWNFPAPGNSRNKNPYFHANRHDKMNVASRNLFALEYVPYPSLNFGDAKRHEIYAHAFFWRDLVNYALGHDKILIIRGKINELVKNNSDAALYKRANDEGRLLRFHNEQKISVTRNNVERVDGGIRAIDKYCENL